MKAFRWILPSLGIVVMASAVGCESNFEPFAESDLTFTILGFLDTDADTQYIRIVPLRQVVDRGGPDPIDARVTTTDLETGAVVVWRDSVIRFADQSYGHVFWAALNVEPDHRYRIDVERSDGARTFAETHVPPRPGEADSVYGALNESGVFAPLYWPGVTNVIDADVSYLVNEIPCNSTGPPKFPPPEEAKQAFVRYTDDDMGVLDNNEWRLDMNLRDDRDVVNDVLDVSSIEACVVIYALLVRLAVPSDDWVPPGGIWDQEVLIQPGTFSNVKGGLGWFGSVARTTVDWQLSLISLRDLNYTQYFVSPI